MSLVAVLLIVLVGLLVIAAIVGGIVLVVRMTSKSSATQPYPQQVGPPMNAPPGWYPDRDHPNLMRYFDGRAWTSSTQPRN
jgi:Protein of unknown function (DUF2510)